MRLLREQICTRRGFGRHRAVAVVLTLALVGAAIGAARWSLYTGLPFLVAKHGCPTLRWSALLCPQLEVHSVYRAFPPVEGQEGWVFDPCAESIHDLVADASWIRMDITATWWQPKPPVALTFLGSEAQRPLGGAPTGTHTAAWGDAGKGYAVAFAANYFGPACGARAPEHYEVVEWPTEDEWRAMARGNKPVEGAQTPP